MRQSGYAALGRARPRILGHYDRGLVLLEKAASLNVNGSQVLNSLGWVKNYACVQPDQAIAHFERAIRLSPRDPEMNVVLNGIALAQLIAGRDEEALIFAQRCIDDSPQFMSGVCTENLNPNVLTHVTFNYCKKAAELAAFLLFSKCRRGFLLRGFRDPPLPATPVRLGSRTHRPFRWLGSQSS
jgi:tetratricopeptide (TPR) repeat protein